MKLFKEFERMQETAAQRQKRKREQFEQESSKAETQRSVRLRQTPLAALPPRKRIPSITTLCIPGLECKCHQIELRQRSGRKYRWHERQQNERSFYEEPIPIEVWDLILGFVSIEDLGRLKCSTRWTRCLAESFKSPSMYLDFSDERNAEMMMETLKESDACHVKTLVAKVSSLSLLDTKDDAKQPYHFFPQQLEYLVLFYKDTSLQHFPVSSMLQSLPRSLQSICFAFSTTAQWDVLKNLHIYIRISAFNHFAALKSITVKFLSADGVRRQIFCSGKSKNIASSTSSTLSTFSQTRKLNARTENVLDDISNRLTEYEREALHDAKESIDQRNGKTDGVVWLCRNILQKQPFLQNASGRILHALRPERAFQLIQTIPIYSRVGILIPYQGFQQLLYFRENSMQTNYEKRALNVADLYQMGQMRVSALIDKMIVISAKRTHVYGTVSVSTVFHQFFKYMQTHKS